MPSRNWRSALAVGFWSIDSRCARIVLVEAGPWLLAPFDPSIGFRNRLNGAVSWCWSYVSFQRGARLITGIRENCGSIPVLRLCGKTVSTGRVFHSSDFYYPFWKIIPELSSFERPVAEPYHDREYRE